MMMLKVRDAVASDHAAVLALNNAHTPHVNALTTEEFAWLAKYATYFRVAEDAEGLAGFVLCVPHGVAYWSGNYKWFSERYNDFLYLDRVVVSPRMRRSGVGRALYEDMHRTCAGRWPRVTLEVNLRPPNPTSIAFHEAMGYQAVGVREYAEGQNAVQMYVRPLAKLEAIWSKRAHRGPMDPLAEARLVPGEGVAGSVGRSRRRQVTIISAEAWAEANALLETPASPDARRANLMVSGINLEGTRGRVLRVGSTRLEIGGETTPCERMEEAAPGLQEALAPHWRAGAFAQVIEGGVVRVGDAVAWES